MTTQLSVAEPARPLRPPIAMSWRRSQQSGLQPADAIQVSRDVDFDGSSRLLAATRPVLDGARSALSGVRAGGLLADAGGTIVGRFFGDADLDAVTDAAGGCFGVPFDEAHTGTNAIATCLETRTPVDVLGTEHYLQCLKAFDCYGLPILNPMTQRLEGVIDLMVDAGCDGRHRRALQVVLDQMVREIEMRLVSDYDPDVQMSLAAFQALTRRTDDPVILFGREFVLHSRRTLDELTPPDLVALEQCAGEAANGDSVTMTLASGREVAVEAARAPKGRPVLLRIRGGIRGRPSVPRTLGRALSITERIDARIAELAAGCANVLVVGERGAGRSHTARRLAGPGAVVLDAAALTDATALTCAGAALVVEEVHTLDPALVPAVAAALTAPAGPRVVLTAVSEARDDLGYVGSLCTEWVELPPLRERLADVPAIAEGMLAQLSADRAHPLRLSAPVLDLLRRHRWPGNMAELAAVVAHSAGRLSVGDIAVTDLPGRYQRVRTVRSGLTPFEQAEWDLIERTLSACDWNKVHTARRLGISRSKLYARLRYFQIE